MTSGAQRASEPAGSRAYVVARLRAAGCVFAEDEADLLIDAAQAPGELAAMLERRVAGLPLELVLGWAEFCGQRIAVDPGVFVPRRRTELLARQAASLVADGPSTVVVDMCCGSGAVGAVLVAATDRPELHAVDVDPAAVECARRNIADAGRVYQGDLFEPLPASLRGRVDVLVANAPYVPSDEIAMMPPEARVHEPRVALDGGSDGLDIVRRVIAAAPAWLAPGGHLLVETSERQAPHVVDAAVRSGLVPQVVSAPDLGATAVVASRPTVE
jgi:release factor glutamine methyltransferase